MKSGDISRDATKWKLLERAVKSAGKSGKIKFTFTSQEVYVVRGYVLLSNIYILSIM